MTTQIGRPPARGRTSAAGACAVAIVAAAALGALALNQQSLWIDELGTWRLTRADSLAAWLHQLLGWRNSDAQLPLYHAWIKLWSGVVDNREWLLRASNLPWLALALYPFWRAPVRGDAVGLVRLAGMVCALHPLTWYYTNELRPYMMVLAATTLTGVGLVGLWMESPDAAIARRARHFLLLGLALLAACSPVGAIWSIAFGPAALWLSWKRHGRSFGFERTHAVAAVLYALLLLPVFAQYLMSFLAGVSAAVIDNKIINFAFAFYELLGLAGVGPGREELRANVGAALYAHGPGVAAAALLLLASLAIGLRALWRQEGARLAVVLALAVLPVFVLFGLAEVKHWRVVGRHLLPFVFFVCLVLAAGLRAAWAARGGPAARAVTGLALAALLVSSLDIRWAERHQREMYAEAARAAAQTLAQGGTVWWFADDAGPEFYGLGARARKLVSQRDYDLGLSHLYDGMQGRVVTDCRAVPPGSLLVFENPPPESLAACPPPARVLYSRREAFDRDGAGAALMQAHGLRPRRSFVGFEVWQ